MTSFDVGGQGRMAVCHDPNGAKFDLWEPRALQGMDADRLQQGVPSWFETLTTDVGRATEFYSALFGWSAEVNRMPGMDYTIFTKDETRVAGMMHVPMEGIPAHWGTYFTVDDADEAARLATELGGPLFVPPTDIPGVGRFCGILSPQGVRFYAIAYPARPGS